MKFGVTKHGFKRKTYSDCLEEHMARVKEVFGVKIDTSETSFLGQLIRQQSYREAELWEELERIYFTPFVNYAEGTGLTNVGDYITIGRRPAQKSKGTITVYGEDEVVVPKGFRVSTKTGIEFETVEEKVIQGNQVDIKVNSVGAGKKYNVAPGTVVDIVNPVYRIDKVTNADWIDGGLDVESDSEFRARYKRSYSKGGGSTAPAITAGILDLKGVVDCQTLENVTMEVDENGLPPKSFAVYVYGGEHDDIVNTILKQKAAGIESHGDIEENVEDSQGYYHTIRYTRAIVQDIHVKIVVTRGEGFKGEDTLIRSIVSYIGGNDNDNIEHSGLKLGQNVIYTKLMGAIMCPGGIADLNLYISTDGKTWKQENIEVGKRVIARTEPGKVVIEYADI